MVNRKLSNVVQKMRLEGLKDENFVMEAVQHTLGGTCYKASDKDDMRKHIDFWWESPRKGKIGIDVKGRKKNKRTDKRFDDSIVWIEFKNVLGHKGWLYGESEYIAFRTEYKIYFVKTKTLRKFSEEKIEGKELVFETPQSFYVPYQRKKYGRLDMMIKVPIEDIISLSEFVIDI